jgi:TPP-dependent pyruvate/acetoin dehydrogenase alpha subunit
MDEIKAAVEDATDYAEAQPDPDPATATRYVYADEPETGGTASTIGPSQAPG